jgi:hypothetical protein
MNLYKEYEKKERISFSRINDSSMKNLVFSSHPDVIISTNEIFIYIHRSNCLLFSCHLFKVRQTYLKTKTSAFFIFLYIIRYIRIQPEKTNSFENEKRDITNAYIKKLHMKRKSFDYTKIFRTKTRQLQYPWTFAFLI